MKAFIPRTTNILKGALDAAEDKGATEFFTWMRVDPDCQVGDAEAMHTVGVLFFSSNESFVYSPLEFTRMNAGLNIK